MRRRWGCCPSAAWTEPGNLRRLGNDVLCILSYASRPKAYLRSTIYKRRRRGGAGGRAARRRGAAPEMRPCVSIGARGDSGRVRARGSKPYGVTMQDLDGKLQQLDKTQSIHRPDSSFLRDWLFGLPSGYCPECNPCCYLFDLCLPGVGYMFCNGMYAAYPRRRFLEFLNTNP